MSLPGLRERVALVVPAGTEGVLRRSLAQEIGELATALGVPVDLVEVAPAHGPRWLVVDSGGAVPELSWDPAAHVLRTRGALRDGLDLLHTLVRRGGGTVRLPPCRTAEDIVARIVDEVGGSYPGFALRGLDWAEICARHRGAADLPALQRWVAELADVHTAVRHGPRHHPPYAAVVRGGDVVFLRVPGGTAAHRAGVRPGWRLDGADADVLARTGAPPHVRPLVAGRRRSPRTRRSGSAPRPRPTGGGSDGPTASWRRGPTTPSRCATSTATPCTCG